MDSKYLLIKQLIDNVAHYEAELSPGAAINMEGFLNFAQGNLQNDYLQKRNLAGNLELEVQERGNKQETTIAILVTFIYRYARLYAKKVLQNSAFSTLDEFSYTITLLTHVSLSKKELIQKNVHEKTTGMEIIKRLLKHGLIRQFNSEEDRRSQRVAITESGRSAVFSVLHKLEDVSTIMTGNLSATEKRTLTNILKKLDHFHFDIFVNEHDKSLPEIIQSKIHH